MDDDLVPLTEINALEYLHARMAGTLVLTGGKIAVTRSWVERIRKLPPLEMLLIEAAVNAFNHSSIGTLIGGLNLADVWDAVAARVEKGLETYGPLSYERMRGIDYTREIREELLDALIYTAMAGIASRNGVPQVVVDADGESYIRDSRTREML